MEYQELAVCDLKTEAEVIEKDGIYNLAAIFANDEQSITGNFAIYYIFMGNGQFRGFKAILEGAGKLEFPSLTSLFQNAAWYEREIHDLFGLVPVGHPDLRRLVLHENWPLGLYPLRKDFSEDQEVPWSNIPYPMVSVCGEGVFEVPVGPIHAGIIEPGHFRFSQSGEQIINVDAKLFFTHRGIEKGVEGLPVQQAIYQAERICGGCSVSHAISYSQAIEAMAQINIPPRSESIRGIVAELERLFNHIGDIGNLCAGLGFSIGVSHGAWLKELLMRLNESVTGNRFLRGMVIPGGVSMDVTLEISQEIQETLHKVVEKVGEMMELLYDNSAFLDRVEGTGILSHRAAIDLGVVGVAARSSGINMDLRRDYPYSIYKRIKFTIPIHTSGDVAARLWTRADEVEQSLLIIREILTKMPSCSGELAAKIPLIKPYTTGLGWSESARGGNLHWLMMGVDNQIYRYFVRSASYHNWPAVAVASPGNILPDFPLINKSFELCYACLDR